MFSNQPFFNEEPVQIFRRLSAKLVIRQGYHYPASSWTYAHWCPACNSLHDFAIDQAFTNGARWTWDGDVQLPTMTPSMNITIGPYGDGKMNICHYYLSKGKLLFLNDCTHGLSAQTVDLPDIPDDALKFSREIQ